jgi:hypothetical protein
MNPAAYKLTTETLPKRWATNERVPVGGRGRITGQWVNHTRENAL